MEFSFDCEKVLSISSSSADKIAILDSSNLTKFIHPMYSSSLSNSTRNLSDILDRMGEASSKVINQFLQHIIKIGIRSRGCNNYITEILLK
jgi:hypothetical protein